MDGQLDEFMSKLYLWGDATPEVGVKRPRLQHGSHQGQILTHHQVQHTGVGQQVITVYKLKMDRGLSVQLTVKYQLKLSN